MRGPPMGSQFDLFLSYIFPFKTFLSSIYRLFFGILDPEIFSSQENVSVNFFLVPFTAGFCSILTSKIVYPLEGGSVKGLPMGYQFVFLSVLYLP